MSGSFWSKLTKLFLLFGVAILGLILAAIAFRLFIEPASSRRMDHYVADLKTKGYRTTPQEILPVIPKERNGAVLWNEMFSRKEDFPKIDPELMKGRGGLLMKAAESFASLSAEERARLIKGIQLTPVFLDYLRRIAACPDFGMEPQDFSRPSYEWKGPNLMGTVRQYRTLFVMAALWGMEGRTREALDLWRLGVQSSRHLVSDRHQVTMLEVILGNLIRKYAFSSLNSICQGHAVPTAELRKIIGDLNPPDLHKVLTDMYELKSACQLKNATEFMAGDMRVVFGDDGETHPWRNRARLAAVWATRPIMRQDLVQLQELTVKRQQIFAKPTWQWPAELAQASIDTYAKQFPKWHIPPVSLILGEDSWIQNMVRSVAHTQAVRLGLACRAYHNDHGKWPEKLADVAPKYLSSLPLDPCTGKPFSYTVAKDGILIAGGGAAYGKNLEAVAWSDGL